MNKDYTPPNVWVWEEPEDDNIFSKINRPTAGAQFEKTLPVGKHPHQLYSLGTPNGVKVSVMFEELLAAGIKEAEYDAWLIKINEGEQFGSDFVKINPNSKIPAMVDHSASEPLAVFESGSILLYLAEKFQAFIPQDIKSRTECLNWLFWQMGASPYVGGGFGHFYVYAAKKMQYCIDRFTMEVKRQLDVLDQHLDGKEFMVGDSLTIADMAIWPWYGGVHDNAVGKSSEFLDLESYKHLRRWAKTLGERPSFKRGRMVNRPMGDLSMQLHERHDASDFELKTQDKLHHKE